jgi:hypothetical protein
MAEVADEDEDLVISRLFQREIMPNICGLEGHQLDILIEKITKYRIGRRAPVVHASVAERIAEGIVTTGVLRENPLLRRFNELRSASSSLSSNPEKDKVFIQSGVNEKEQPQEDDGGFDPERVYSERVQMIAHMLGGCGGKSYPKHSHDAGQKFSIHRKTSSRIGDQLVMYY